MTVILDGKKLSEEIRKNIKKEDEILQKNYSRVPGLAVVLVGNNEASKIYVNMKVKACQEAGFYSRLLIFDEEISEEELIFHIEELNRDENIDGILVQLPLPEKINELKINSTINIYKDVDGFNPVNLGRLFLGEDCFIPCTPKGIIRLLKHYNVEISGKNAVVIGRSNIVGKPAGILLLSENATVTFCHSKTRELKDYTRNADIIVSAVGKPGLITADMVKEGVVIIDAATVKVDGKLVGDVLFDEVSKKASFITPVPGGVGPMTIAMLLENTLYSFKKKLETMVGGR